MQSIQRPKQRPNQRLRLASAAAVLCLSTGLAAQEANTSNVTEARAALQKWVEVNGLISKERSDWNLERDLMAQQIELRKQQIAALESSMEDADKSLGETEKKRGELVAKQAELITASKGLGELVAPLERRVLDLCKQLPQMLADKVEVMRVQIPDPDKKPESGEQKPVREKSLGDRFMYMIGVLGQADKFHSQVHIRPEQRDMGDGTTSSVTTMYVGLGGAFFADTQGLKGGVARPSTEGWVWSAANAAAEQIASAVAIYRETKGAEFTALPVEIK